MSLPPLPDIKELLHDVDTHGNLWSRLAGGQNYHALFAAVTAFRAAGPTDTPTSFASVLASVDAILAHTDVIRTSLEDHQDDAASDEIEGNRRYFKHELKAFDRLADLRRSMIALPPRGETPLAELEAFQRYALLLGKEIIVEFDSRDGAVVIDLAYAWTDPVEDADIGERIVRLTDCLVACDIEDWKDGAGADGRIRISGIDAPWIDAVDRKEDWQLERYVDLEALAEMTWDDGYPDVAP
jgi:hypothetical protein